MTNILVYTLENKIYVNLTNRCTNNCIFCVRNDKNDVCGQELWLDNENYDIQDLIEQFEKIYAQTPSKEVVFCGYGEPMLKLEQLKALAEYIKSKFPDTKIRVNTNGHANFVYKKNVVPEIKGLVDEFSVSLNGATKEEYNEYSQPKIENAYDEVKSFIRCCSNEGISVVATVVEGYKGQHLDLDSCKKIAGELGAKFRVREWIVNGY